MRLRTSLTPVLCLLVACATVPPPVASNATIIPEVVASSVLVLHSGGFAAEAFADQTVGFYDSSGRRTASIRLQSKGAVQWAALPGTDIIALTETPGLVTIHILDVATARELRRFRFRQDDSGDVNLHWAAGGGILVVGGYYRLSGYDTVTGEEVWTWKEGQALYPSVDPTGARIALLAGSRPAVLVVMDSRTGEVGGRIPLPECDGMLAGVDWRSASVVDVHFAESGEEHRRYRRITVDVTSGTASSAPDALGWRCDSWKRLPGTGTDVLVEHGAGEDIVDVLAAGNPVRRFRVPGYIQDIEVGSNGRVLVATGRRAFWLDTGVAEATMFVPEDGAASLREAADQEAAAVAAVLSGQPSCQASESESIATELKSLGGDKGVDGLEQALPRALSCLSAPVAQELLRLAANLLPALVDAAKANCSLLSSGQAAPAETPEATLWVATSCGQIKALEEKRKMVSEAAAAIPDSVLLAIALDQKAPEAIRKEARTRLLGNGDLDQRVRHHLEALDLPSLEWSR